MQHQQTPHNDTTDTDGVLPQGFKIVLGTVLLIVSVGVMSFLGVFI